jgi:MFS transporter, DHA1 family, multidrug resistance protein
MNVPVVKNVSDESARSTAKLAPTAYLIGLMAALTALGQFASNVYLPALPAVSAELDASMQQVQWTLAVFLIVFGVGQLIYGPLSDRFGRLGPLRAGLVVYVVGSIAAAVAPTLAALPAPRPASS